MVNARIRKAYLKNKLKIFSLGDPGDLTYPYDIVGEKTDDFKKIIDNNHLFSKTIKSSKKPLIIIGESVLELKCGPYIFEECKDYLFKNNFINENWNALNILIQNASTVGGVDLGLIDQTNGKKI